LDPADNRYLSYIGVTAQVDDGERRPGQHRARQDG